MDRLSGLDGAFLSLESPTTHLQILGALIFDPTEVEGGVDFWTVRSLVADRLPRVPPFRQRLVEVPFGLQHPAMVDDPGFDLDYHVRRVRLPEPGGRDELAAMVADVASRPLDRGRPLWEFHVVEGLEGGRLAIVPKVHHAIIDGVAGAQVMAAFFDLSPVPAPVLLFGRDTSGPAANDPRWQPSPLPGEVERWREVLSTLPGHVEALARTVSRSLRSGVAPGMRRETAETPSPAPFEAPRTSVNRAISPHRRVALAELPLADIRHVGESYGGTTNDVVLAATSGALRAYFDGRGETLETSLVGMVPVSVRSSEEEGALGNRVSAMLVSLASEVDDPVDRLRLIRRETAAAKEEERYLDAGALAGWAQAAVPSVATRLARLVTNLRVFDHLSPLFNVIISNVPGPDVPLYLAGARMVAMYPFGPIIEGVGINVTVFSYLDHVYVGVQGCRVLTPDLDGLARGMEASLGELVARANRRGRPVPWWHAELPA
jgi:diacylglycerol O-acyltransferase / wax synthase